LLGSTTNDEHEPVRKALRVREVEEWQKKASRAGTPAKKASVDRVGFPWARSRAERIHDMQRRLAISLIATLLLGVLVRPLPASAVDKIWVGYVVHVSTNNIKVINSEGTKTLSFLIVPKFNQIFSADGKTTYQMAQIKRNTLVKIYYDQGLLGQAHADKIYVLNGIGQVQHSG
jgi:hypothetical protein